MTTIANYGRGIQPIPLTRKHPASISASPGFSRFQSTTWLLQLCCIAVADLRELTPRGSDMISVSLDDTGYTGHILLAPNMSLNWQTNVRMFVIIACISLIIAGFFVHKGGWLVLPFSGLALLMIIISLYMFFHHYKHREVIRFTDQKVVVEHGKDTPEKSWEYQRHWSKIHVQEHGVYDIPKVSIKSHGREMEPGAFQGQDWAK